MKVLQGKTFKSALKEVSFVTEITLGHYLIKHDKTTEATQKDLFLYILNFIVSDVTLTDKQ